MRKIRVLLVDDTRPLLAILRLILQRSDDLDVVGQASDGEQAVRLAERLQPDAVLMDVTLPKVDGIEATRQIRAKCPAAKIIALSMHQDDQTRAQMLAAGAVAYLTKATFLFDALIATIRAAVADSRRNDSGQPA